MKRPKLFILLTCIFISFIFNHAEAVPALNKTITVFQPDGTEITFSLHGDEFFHYKTTPDGYLLTEDSIGLLNYAFFDSLGNIMNTNVKASDISKRSPAEIKLVATLVSNPDIALIKKASKIQRSNNQINSDSTTSQRVYPLNGAPKSLVILVNFTDRSFVTPTPQIAYTNLLNQKGYTTNGGTGSARDYFRDNSMSVFNPQFDVVGPFNLKNNIAFYGGNVSGSDKNPRQMVIDACALADSAGVDFAQYDTDNDGKVDNIFIYYAGYNEAEGGPANTVWPHRWSLANYSTKFDGKIIFDYACTSELKGSTGSNMCGVGTFCHEFGHVLGLPDLYSTNDGTYHTLYTWDVMDYGPYLNGGRTPPFYSGYERFLLGWMTPVEIKTPEKFSIDTLSTSNKAYLISQNGAHNLNGANPNPVEFFMLENRQLKSWDTYLPNHGLLITHVFYSDNEWSENSVNNIATAMGVDIEEADGISTDASCGGDAFPGTSMVKTFIPTLRVGTDIGKPLTEITETNGIISFKFMGGQFLATVGPVATAATNITPITAILNWSTLSFSSAYLLDVYQMTDGQKVYLTGYQNKNVGNIPAYAISGLSPGTTYYYVVRGTNGTIATVNSNEISVTTLVYTFDLISEVALNATNIGTASFSANWKSLEGATNYYIDVYKKAIGTAVAYENYDFTGALPTGWTTNDTETYTSTPGYFGLASPAMRFSTTGLYLQTGVFDRKIVSIQFWYRGTGSTPDKTFKISGSTNGIDWADIKIIRSVSNNAQTITIALSDLTDYKALRFDYVQPGSGSMALDDIKIGIQDVSNFLLADYTNLSVGNITSNKISNLESGVQYFYTIVASNGVLLSQKSNEIAVTTAATTATDNTKKSKIIVSVLASSIQVHIGSALTTPLQLMNSSGQILFECAPTTDVSIAKDKFPHGIYILKVGNEKIKLIL